ncbi:16782_t:CDS:1, partial [Gigaspora rosea]
SKEKLTVKLEDNREISVLIDDLNKKWFFKDIKPEELKHYEI